MTLKTLPLHELRLGGPDTSGFVVSRGLKRAREGDSPSLASSLTASGTNKLVLDSSCKRPRTESRDILKKTTNGLNIAYPHYVNGKAGKTSSNLPIVGTQFSAVDTEEEEMSSNRAYATEALIMCLPNELLLALFSYSSAVDVCLMGATCKFFHDIVRSEALWRTLFLRDFSNMPLRNRLHTTFCKSWVWLYMSKAVVFESREAAQIAYHKRFGSRSDGIVIGSYADRRDNIYWEGEFGSDGALAGYGLGIALGAGKWDAGLYCEGSWLNGSLHGFGGEFFADGEYSLGTWVHNTFTGRGTQRWASGKIYKGDFVDGLCHGKGMLTLPATMGIDAGTYLGEFSNGDMHGQGVTTFLDGSKYVGLWEKNVRSGMGRMTYASGVVYTGLWRNNVRHGKGTLSTTSKGGVVYEGEWENDVWKHGVCRKTAAFGGDSMRPTALCALIKRSH